MDELVSPQGLSPRFYGEEWVVAMCPPHFSIPGWENGGGKVTPVFRKEPCMEQTGTAEVTGNARTGKQLGALLF